jgi:capsular polysaccharide biosynthesis protein
MLIIKELSFLQPLLDFPPVYDIESVEIADGSIVLQCGKIDPQILLNLPEPLEKPASIPLCEVTYTNSVSGNIQLFWDYGEGLSEENSTNWYICLSNEPKTLLLPIVNWKDSAKLTAFRVDPPNGTNFVLKSVKIIECDSTTLESHPIHVVSEDSVNELTTQELRPAFRRYSSSFSKAWSGMVGGVTPPRWWTPDLMIPGGALKLFSIENAYYVPSMGTVLTADGGVFRITVGQAKYVDPNLEKLQTIWTTRISAARIADGIVTMAYGSLYNYGHFVLDAMTSVAAVNEDISRQAVFVTPPLQDWQRQHFKLLQIEPVELAEPIYLFDHITFVSSVSGMGRALHNPNLHFLTLRDSQLSSLPSATNDFQRIYISRRGHKRPLVNEDKLEQTLKEVGFVVIQPETMPVSKQIEIFRSSKIIVAPTGAALANLLYAQKATVFEIIPRDMTLNDNYHKWVAFLTAMGEGDWRPFFCEDMPGYEQLEIAGIKQAGYKPFEISIEDIMSFISPVLV